MRKGTRKYTGIQKLFNRRRLIIHLCVKMLMSITHKKLSVTAKPRKIYTEILGYPGMQSCC